jgi:hypothetical protein
MLLPRARGAASSSSTSRPGAHTIRVSSRSCSTDPGGSRLSQWTPVRASASLRLAVRAQMRSCPQGWPALVVAESRKAAISAACSQVALAFVLSTARFRFLEQLEISGGHAANPSAFPVFDLDQLRRHAHRRHADNDVETSPIADDCSDFEHGRMRTPTGCTTSASATRPSAPIPRFGTAASIAIESRLGRAGSSSAPPHSRSKARADNETHLQRLGCG